MYFCGNIVCAAQALGASMRKSVNLASKASSTVARQDRLLCHLLFRAWMSLVVNPKHMFHGQLGVALRRSQAFVPEHFLDGTQICPFFQHVSPERVPQCVRMHVRRQAFCHCDCFDDAAHAACRQPPSPLIDEESRSVLAPACKQFVARW